MGAKGCPPLYTLRGHNKGVTALAFYNSSSYPRLISGDEEGTIIFWNLSTLKKSHECPKIFSSQIQSLRLIKFETVGINHDVLVVQSRDNGVQLWNIENEPSDMQPQVMASFPTYESIFSRGDAINIDCDKAILAYPSYLESSFVTLRVVNSKCQTEISGSAERTYGKDEKKGSIFDVVIKKGNSNNHHLFVAYEDGCLCMFRFSHNITKTVPILKSTGMKIDQIRKFNLSTADFISAFDIVNFKESNIIAACGSPSNKLSLLVSSIDGDLEPIMDNITLKRSGVSAISIRPDKKLVAVGAWDTSIQLYSLKSQKLLATLKHHLKQVQDIIFIYGTNSCHLPFDLDTSTGANKYLLCCASLDGTISISNVY